MSSVIRNILLILILVFSLFVLSASNDRFPNHPLQKFALQLGLDLQGGSYILLQADVNQALVGRLEQIMIQLRNERQSDWKFSVDRENVRLTLTHVSREDEVWLAETLEKNYPLLRFAEINEETLTLRYKSTTIEERNQYYLDQAIEVVRSRVDLLGVTEPDIVSSGPDRIIVQMPGIANTKRAKEILQKTSQLRMQFIREYPSPEMEEWLDEVLKDKERTQLPVRDAAYLRELNEWFGKEIPEGADFLFGNDDYGLRADGASVGYILESEILLTGDRIQDSQVSFNEQNQPNVTLELDTRGAQIFERMTARENRGRGIAIVLDGFVESTMVVDQPVIGRWVAIELGAGRDRNDLLAQAKDINLTLQSGSLPMELEIIQENTVGASLGQDSVEKGRLAILVGYLLVAVFMVLWYRGFGLVAVFSLTLNVLLVFSGLALLGATLTLPGLAGIALTVGMAVDANVIVFERIREEFRLSSVRDIALSKGYDRALSAILDSGLTTAAAGIVLIVFTSGPLRGFAVTLLLGLVTSFFTAYFASRWMMESNLGRFSDGTFGEMK